MSVRVTTYKQAFEGVLGMPIDDKVNGYIKKLESEGFVEKGIAFAIWKKQEKLMVYRKDSRFFPILRNEVKKYCWKKDDPRWDEYWKKKNEETRAKKLQGALDSYRNDPMNDQQLEKKAFGRKKPPGYVYFIQGLYGGAIKIGYSKDPEGRLKTLQTGYPDTLRILLLVPGSELTEKYFHREFELYKLNGEWFKPEREIMDRIEKLKEKYAQV